MHRAIGRRNSILVFLVGSLLAGCNVPGSSSPSTPVGGAAAPGPSSSSTSTSVPSLPPTVRPTQKATVLPHSTVDPSTLTGKLMMGYQGWFACPGDGSRLNGYFTWIRDGYSTISAESYLMDMWPDTSELTASEKCPTELKYADGRPAYLYSSARYETVLRHFQWMSEYGIDGVFLQRFAGQLSAPDYLDFRNKVTGEVRDASDAYGRVWAIMYDVTGMEVSGPRMVPILELDWKYLVDKLKVTESPTYLHHNGLPVLAIWGLGFDDRPGTPAMAQELVDFFENNPDPKYRVTLMGGVPIWWRTLQSPSSSDPAWADYYCSLDIISPWTVGVAVQDAEVDDYYTRAVVPDMARAKECGAEFMPVVYPGHSYHNADPSRPLNQYPRRGGRLYWRQVYDAVSAGASMIYNAMFDEVNEGTAMYKVAATSADVPQGLQVVTNATDGECLPSDWYLRLGGQATKMLRGEIPLTAAIPISAPPPNDPSACKAAPSLRLRVSTTSDWTTVSLEGVQIDSLQVASSSPEASTATIADNQLVLTQAVDRANAGQSVEMSVDLFLTGLGESDLTLTVGRGNIGGTTVDLYAVKGSDSSLVKTLQWSGLAGTDGKNLKVFQLPASLFSSSP
jgi:hypothetical protein